MEKRPNIIIFNPDQWRGDVFGHLGNPAAQTPNLLKILKEQRYYVWWGGKNDLGVN